MPSSSPFSSSPSSSKPSPLFADVIVPRRLNRAFTYRIPSHLQDRLRVGSLVWVPFGPSTLKGLVVSLTIVQDQQQGWGRRDERALKEILSLHEGWGGHESQGDLLPMAQYLADYYLAPIGQCIRLIAPAEKPSPVSIRYRITDAGVEVLQTNKRLSSLNRSVLARLAGAAKGLTLGTLRQSVKGTTAKQLLQFKKKRWVVQETNRKRSVASISTKGPADDVLPSYLERELSPDSPSSDCSAFRTDIGHAFERESFTPMFVQASAPHRLQYLLHAMELALVHQKGVLVVTGEVHRACLIGESARRRWPGHVEILHGRLTARARAGVWERIRKGTATIVVGTRSTIFAPVESLGLICIDAEEETSLKDEQSPRFHARDVAWERAKNSHAVLLLGSSHPSLETFHAIEDRQTTAFVHRNRPQAPTIQFVDFRQVPHGTLLAESMKQGMAQALGKGGKVILYHNRKGFAPLLVCRDCGVVPRCQSCHVSLTYYRQSQCVTCQICGVSYPVPDHCSSCLAARLEPVGFGTEWLEEEIRRAFPKARVARLDRDASPRRFTPDQIRENMWAGAIDVLIGTQMVFQGPTLPLVDFVGIPYADAGLHFPDFRAAEWTYHALCDAVALAKPEQDGGRVMLQSYLFEHHTVQAVLNHDPHLFYGQELSLRSSLSYPPFSTLMSLRVLGHDAGKVLDAAQRWGVILHKTNECYQENTRQPSSGDEILGSSVDIPDVMILGPVPSTWTKGSGGKRWQLLVKSIRPELAREIVKETRQAMEQEQQWKGLQFEVDVDPVDIG